jgi:hypothetical protein
MGGRTVGRMQEKQNFKLRTSFVREGKRIRNVYRRGVTDSRRQLDHSPTRRRRGQESKDTISTPGWFISVDSHVDSVPMPYGHIILPNIILRQNKNKIFDDSA